MAKFKNVSPLGALEVPFLGKTVEAGEVFEVSADIAGYFAGQAATFQPVSAPRPKPAAKNGNPKKAAVVSDGDRDVSRAPGADVTTDTEEKEASNDNAA